MSWQRHHSLRRSRPQHWRRWGAGAAPSSALSGQRIYRDIRPASKPRFEKTKPLRGLSAKPLGGKKKESGIAMQIQPLVP